MPATSRDPSTTSTPLTAPTEPRSTAKSSRYFPPRSDTTSTPSSPIEHHAIADSLDARVARNARRSLVGRDHTGRGGVREIEFPEAAIWRHRDGATDVDLDTDQCLTGTPCRASGQLGRPGRNGNEEPLPVATGRMSEERRPGSAPIPVPDAPTESLVPNRFRIALPLQRDVGFGNDAGSCEAPTVVVSRRGMLVVSNHEHRVCGGVDERNPGGRIDLACTLGEQIPKTVRFVDASGDFNSQPYASHAARPSEARSR